VAASSLALRLYHRPGSRSERVRWLLSELGAAYELTELTQADQATDEHRRRHPLGRVPVLDDGQGPVYESTAICLQLADLDPDAALIPPVGSHGRALVYQWALFAMTELESALADVSYGTAAGDGRGAGAQYPEPGPDLVAAASRRFRAAARVVDDALAGHEYLVGDRFGVADVVVGSVLSWADDVALLGDDFPGLSAYLRRLRARSGYAY
jgi:glutathione S-transferase